MQWFKVRKPKDLRQEFIGKHLTVYPTAQDVWKRANGRDVCVTEIRGNMTHVTMFEINSEYLVSMLDAYSQLNREPLPNLTMHEDFLSTVAEHVVETKKASLIDKEPPRGQRLLS